MQRARDFVHEAFEAHLVIFAEHRDWPHYMASLKVSAFGGLALMLSELGGWVPAADVSAQRT